ncbi:MAG: acetylglutamate kinase [Chitinispirillaceae bacterium]
MMQPQTICIKIGGSTIDAPGLLDELGQAIKRLVGQGHKPMLVHGGGKDIARQLKLLNKEFTFVEGMRVTDAQTMQTVQMVLSGDVNKRIVNALLCEKVRALGISGVDGDLFNATRLLINNKDIGHVGTIEKVDDNLIRSLLACSLVPVISPVSRDRKGDIYNVNADVAASELAVGMKVDHLIFISDVPGVKIDGEILHEIPTSKMEQLITAGQITGGMIPKIRSAAQAVSRGVGRVHIAGWHGSETLVSELSVDTAHGTVIYR